MNAATTVRTVLKVFFLLLLLLVIVLGGIYWFDHLGIIDYKRMIGPLGQYLPAFMQRGVTVDEGPFLLEKELLGKREEVLRAQQEGLDARRAELENKELELKEIETKLFEETKRLEAEKKVLSEKLSEYDNYRENVTKQAGYFSSMPPDAAVERLAQLDDLLVIDILRQIDRTAEEEGKLSVVPYFLSLMDPGRAAAIQRKMTKVGVIY